jgi:hypothetical protein
MSSPVLDRLFAYEIRRYHPGGNVLENWAFWFNLAESLAWFTIAVLILLRWRRYRRSWEEWVYAGLFVAFGLTDVREAFVLETWLLWVKVVNFLAILWMRSRVLKNYYPGWKTY